MSDYENPQTPEGDSEFPKTEEVDAVFREEDEADDDSLFENETVSIGEIVSSIMDKNAGDPEVAEEVNNIIAIKENMITNQNEESEDYDDSGDAEDKTAANDDNQETAGTEADDSSAEKGEEENGGESEDRAETEGGNAESDGGENADTIAQQEDPEIIQETDGSGDLTGEENNSAPYNREEDGYFAEDAEDDYPDDTVTTGSKSLSRDVTDIMAQPRPRLFDENGEVEKPPKKNARRFYTICAALFALVLIAGGFVLYSYHNHYKTHFMADTYIDGVNVSEMTADEAIDAVRKARKEQELDISIVDRDGNTSVLKGKNAGITIVPADEFEDTVRELLAKQKPSLTHYDTKNDTEMVAVEYDEEALKTALKNLSLFKDAVMPTDAYIEDTEDGHQIVKEEEGNMPVFENVFGKVLSAIRNMKTEVTLDAEKDYVHPQITSKDEELNRELEEWEKIETMTIRYTLPDESTITLSKQRVLSFFEKDTFQVDEEKVEKYVKSLAEKYDTVGKERFFRTTAGGTVTVSGGTYGWKVDVSKETRRLIRDLTMGGKIQRAPIWKQEGYFLDKNGDDIGNTYLELDYTNQTLYLYENGRLSLQAPFVSGNMSTGNGSPDGVFYINEKQSPAVLMSNGEPQNSSYFVGFGDHTGIYDANWRDDFTADAYLENGSAGGIETTLEAANAIYNGLEEGTPIISFYSQNR